MMRKNQIALFLFAAIIIGISEAHLWKVTSEFNSKIFDSAELSSWAVQNFAKQQTSLCGDTTIVGGYDIAGKSKLSKTFQSPVSPKSLTISFDLYLLDKWFTSWEPVITGDDQILLKINNVIHYNIASKFDEQMHSKSPNVCGAKYRDRVTRVSITIPFTEQSFNLSIEGDFNKLSTPDRMSWGIRDLTIYAEYDQTVSTVVLQELKDSTNFGESNWQVVGGDKKQTKYNCGDYALLGGYGFSGPETTFTRKIQNLPSHTFITIRFRAFFIDSIDRNDSLIIYLDNKIIHEFSQNETIGAQDLCGKGKSILRTWNLQTYGETLQDVYLRVPHTSSSAEVKLFVNTDQNSEDESFGFRDFQVEVSSPCPIIYSESNGQGNSLQFCGNIPNLKQVGWTGTIKGIYIPEGINVTVYEGSDYQGKKFTISKTNLNLSGKEYVLVNKAFNISVNDNSAQKKLRHQN